MTNIAKKHYDQMKTVAYWSQLGVVEVKKILYGIDDYIVCISGTSSGKRRYHQVKIHYAKKPYIVILGTKLYLADAI